MAYTQTQIDELRDAIATGALSVKHGDKLVTHRSLEEMIATLTRMEAELAGAAARPPFVRVATSKGTSE